MLVLSYQAVSKQHVKYRARLIWISLCMILVVTRSWCGINVMSLTLGVEYAVSWPYTWSESKHTACKPTKHKNPWQASHYDAQSKDIHWKNQPLTHNMQDIHTHTHKCTKIIHKAGNMMNLQNCTWI